MDPNTEAKGQTRRSRYPAELRERSVRMMREHRRECASEHQALPPSPASWGSTPRP